jgi:hypothetical protein
VRQIVFVITLCSAGILAHGEQMSVSLCDVGGVRQPILARARMETELVFRSAKVDVAWVDCDETRPQDSQGRVPVFVIRLRTDITPRATKSVSLEEMGRAFVSDDSAGFLADAYVPAVQAVAERYQADAGMLLGFVIAHELGHLILGPGHTPDGIMCARWEGKEVRALRQRWLRFNRTQAQSIRNFFAVRK